MHRKNGMDIGKSIGAGALSKHRGIRKIIKEHATHKWIILQRYKYLEK
jgi:hypothetical protein